MTNAEIGLETLIGTWGVVEAGSFLRLNEGGSYRIFISIDDIEGSTVRTTQPTRP